MPQQSDGDAADGAQVLSNLLAHLAISSSSSLHQYAILIGQAHRQAVDLQLAHKVEVSVIEKIFGPPVPRLEALQLKGIGQAEHRLPVLNLGEG